MAEVRERLSRGQKKKLRLRAHAEQALSAPSVMPPRMIMHSESIEENNMSGDDDEHENGFASSASSLTPSASSSPPSRSLIGDADACSEDLEGSSVCDGDESFRDDACHVADAPSRPLLGWPSPGGVRPPRWPPLGAELMSVHSVDSLPLLQTENGPRLHLVALPCPQPDDPLQWRFYPLLRNALALADDGLSLQELTKYVEANLPAVCISRMTTTRLRGLISLVLARTSRHGRMLRQGKRYVLPRLEDPLTSVPQLAPLASLSALWIAWSVDMKRPREVALKYLLDVHGSVDSREFWLSGKVGSKTRTPEGADVLQVGCTAAWLLKKENEALWCGGWRDVSLGTAWSLLAPIVMPVETVGELLKRCIEQAAVSADVKCEHRYN